MATAQLLMLADGVDNKVTRINEEVKGVGDTVRAVQTGARDPLCLLFYPSQRLYG